MRSLTPVLATSLFAALVALTAPAHAQTVQDSINVAATPASTTWNATEVGWFYTPTLTYSLSSVQTLFGLNVNGNLVTEEVRIGSGNAIGSLLASGAFTPTANAFSGATFAPLTLTAGQTYFIGFRNVGGESVNVTESGTNLGMLRYSFNNNGSYSGTEANYFTAQPILRFLGASPTAVPEPGSVGLLASLGVSGVGFLVRRRKQAKKAA